MQIIDLLSLTRAMLNPADRIAWLSVLRAPWCGLDLKDLFHLTNSALPEQNPKPSKARLPLILLQLTNFELIKELSDEGKQILARVQPLLIDGWQQRQRKSLRSSIEDIWLSLGGKQLASHYQSHNSSNAFFNLLEQHEVAGTIADWDIFTNAINRLYAEPQPDSDPQLQIMTIHKAKGLEFDTVIIPGMNRKSAPGNNPLMMWREGLSEQGQAQLIISPVASAGEDSDATYQHLKYEQKLKEQLENTRVMYVGATRAIKRLHLLYSSKANGKPGSGSLLESLRPYLNKQLSEDNSEGLNQNVLINTHTAEAVSESDSAKPSLPIINQLSRFKPSIKLPVIGHIDKQIDAVPNPTEQTELSITGTVLHRILRQITLDGVQHWDQQTLIERSAFWRLQLSRAGSQQIEDNIQRLQKAINNVLQDTDNHWLFDNQLKDSQCEYALGYMDQQGSSRIAIVDRTFILGTGANARRWIIDYKLSEPQQGQSLEAFFNHQKNQYQGQLNHYAKLLKNQQQLPVKTALYLPLQSKLLTMHDYGN